MAGIEEKDAAQFIGRALGCLEISRGGREERGERGLDGWYRGEGCSPVHRQGTWMFRDKQRRRRGRGGGGEGVRGLDAGIEEKDAAQFIGRALGCLEISRGGGGEG